jgi:hypothetical protein
MKTYQIELKRTSFVNVEVEAANPEEAEAQAWRAIESRHFSDAEWNLWSIEEVTPC